MPKPKRGLLILPNPENGMALWRKIIQGFLGKAGEEYRPEEPARTLHPLQSP